MNASICKRLIRKKEQTTFINFSANRHKTCFFYICMYYLSAMLCIILGMYILVKIGNCLYFIFNNHGSM